jgi:two-component system, OmpR family, phosphate regulon sensor histidine kinase PhoR
MRMIFNQFFSGNNSRLAGILSVFMGIALLGALSIQLLLLGEAYKNQETDFDQQVAQALRNITQSLERIDARQSWRSASIPDFYQSRTTTFVMRPDEKLLISEFPKQELAASELWNRQNEFPHIQLRLLKDGSYFVQIQERTVQKSAMQDSSMNDLMWRSFRWMMPLDERFDFHLVDSVIRAELRLRGLKTPYRFAVTESAMLTSLHTERFLPGQDDYKVALFPNDFFSGSRFLFLNFPAKTSYLYRQMWLIWALMLVFLSGIILIFGFTLRQMQKQKKLANIKSDFINNMTHEFKTPLATINLAVDALNNPLVQSDQEKLAHYTKIIKQENKRMNNQVEQVLRMAMIDKNEMEFDQTTLNLVEVVEEAIAHFQLQVEGRNGKIKFAPPKNTIWVKADPVHLLSIFTNILDNANKYSPNAPEIAIKMYQRENAVFTEISDKGIGMSKDVQKQVFDRFFRAAGGDIHNVKGHGLGLSYVKELLEAHQGEITLESSPGIGSTFTIKLPLILEKDAQ